MPRSPSSALALALAACGARPATPAIDRCAAPGVVLARQADVARVAGCATLRGLTVRSGSALDLSALRGLTTITGDLVIGPTVAIEELTLRDLRVVDGAIRVAGNGLLQGVYLPRLERAGAIAIEGNAALTTLALPALAAVRGELRVADDASLELLDLGGLTTIAGALVLTGVPRLALVEAGQLQRAAAVQLVAPALAPELADRLRGLSP